MSSRGMGAISPSKMPKAKRKARRDDTDFDQYNEGGEVEEKKTEDAKPEKKESLADKIAEREKLFESKDKPRLTPGASAKSMLPQNVRLGSKKVGYAFQLGKDEEIEPYIGRDRVGVNYRKTFKNGGKTKSKVNAAGVYTKPGMRKSLFESIKSQAVQGTAAGQWSARKAQLLAKRYKEKGGSYRG